MWTLITNIFLLYCEFSYFSSVKPCSTANLQLIILYVHNTFAVSVYCSWRHAQDTKYTVSQKTSHLWLAITWSDFDTYPSRNVTNKVGNQKTLYYATSNNLCFCTTWQNEETQQLCCMHTTPVRCLPERKKMLYVMCLIAFNICWDSKITHALPA